jgi:hypothetical protein
MVAERQRKPNHQAVRVVQEARETVRTVGELAGDRFGAGQRRTNRAAYPTGGTGTCSGLSRSGDRINVHHGSPRG